MPAPRRKLNLVLNLLLVMSLVPAVSGLLGQNGVVVLLVGREEKIGVDSVIEEVALIRIVGVLELT